MYPNNVENRTARLNIYFTQSEYRQLIEAAADAGMSAGRYIREKVGIVSPNARIGNRRLTETTQEIEEKESASAAEKVARQPAAEASARTAGQ